MEHRGRKEGSEAPNEAKTARPAPVDEETLRGALRPRGPVRFGMTEVHQPDAVWLEIQGEIDILTSARLAAQLDALVRQSRANLVLDLRRTEFIDSAGLQILLGTQRRLGRVSRKLTVVCGDGPVRRLIEMTRLAEPLGLTWPEESAPPG